MSKSSVCFSHLERGALFTRANSKSGLIWVKDNDALAHIPDAPKSRGEPVYVVLMEEEQVIPVWF